MLPDLIVIVSAYVVLRCLQIALQNKESFAGEWPRIIVIGFSMIVALVAIVGALDVLILGVKTSMPSSP